MLTTRSKWLATLALPLVVIACAKRPVIAPVPGCIGAKIVVDTEKGCYTLIEEDGLTLRCPVQVFENGKSVTKLLETKFSNCKRGDNNGYRQ